MNNRDFLCHIRLVIPVTDTLALAYHLKVLNMLDDSCITHQLHLIIDLIQMTSIFVERKYFTCFAVFLSRAKCCARCVSSWIRCWRWRCHMGEREFFRSLVKCVYCGPNNVWTHLNMFCGTYFEIEVVVGPWPWSLDQDFFDVVYGGILTTLRHKQYW